jgi:hypothetical protein
MTYDLCCAECSTATNACERGWRGFLADADDEPAEVVILCPACAESECPRRETRLDES